MFSRHVLAFCTYACFVVIIVVYIIIAAIIIIDICYFSFMFHFCISNFTSRHKFQPFVSRIKMLASFETSGPRIGLKRLN